MVYNKTSLGTSATPYVPFDRQKQERTIELAPRTTAVNGQSTVEEVLQNGVASLPHPDARVEEEKMAFQKRQGQNDISSQTEDAGRNFAAKMTAVIVASLFVLLFSLPGSGGRAGCGSNHTGSCYRSRGGRASSGRSRSGGRGGGGRGGGSCFPAGEIVDLLPHHSDHSSSSSNSAKPIELIRPGQDVALHGGIVLATMKLLLSPNDPLYRYNNSVRVTGSHKVWEHGHHLIPVEQSQFATTVLDAEHASPTHVYNLVTSKHRIVINNTIFADWDEDDVATDWESEHRLLATLNQNNQSTSRFAWKRRPPSPSSPPSPSGGVFVVQGAFDGDCLVRLANGENRSIRSVDVGDEAEAGGVVYGVVEVFVPPSTRIFRYNGCRVTGRTLVKEGGVWQRVSGSGDVTFVGEIEESGVFHQLITKSHRLVVGGMMYADYEVVEAEFDDADFENDTSISVFMT